MKVEDLLSNHRRGMIGWKKFFIVYQRYQIVCGDPSIRRITVDHVHRSLCNGPVGQAGIEIVNPAKLESIDLLESGISVGPFLKLSGKPS